MTTCPECNDTGERDSGGTTPWGEPVYLPCDCKDAEIGRRWREDSSLEKWFPLTAERLAKLEAENAALKRDLQYARDGLTKGRRRMREDNERLREALGEVLAWGTDENYQRAKVACDTARSLLGPNAELRGAKPIGEASRSNAELGEEG